MNNYFWMGTVDTSVLDTDGYPGSGWIIHLFNPSDTKRFTPCEESEQVCFSYKSCCGKDTITTVDPPSEPDTYFLSEPPEPGIKNEELYCKDCIKIWENMQSR